MTVVELVTPEDTSRLCERVLADLPDWFGFEDVNAAYVRDIAGVPTFAAGDDGFIALKIHTPRSTEVYVMGVLRGVHGKGIGTALISAAEPYLRVRGVEYLQVKTLGPSHPDEGYPRTRGFYEARGFVGLEELHDL